MKQSSRSKDGGGLRDSITTEGTPQKKEKGAEFLEKYLKEGKDRIYDMLSMLDTYGFKRKAEEAKKQFMLKFPESDLAKAADAELKKTTRRNN